MQAACLEAHSRGKLGTVVFQFQLGFKPTEQVLIVYEALSY